MTITELLSKAQSNNVIMGITLGWLHADIKGRKPTIEKFADEDYGHAFIDGYECREKHGSGVRDYVRNRRRECLHRGGKRAAA